MENKRIELSCYLSIESVEELPNKFQQIYMDIKRGCKEFDNDKDTKFRIQKEDELKIFEEKFSN